MNEMNEWSVIRAGDLPGQRHISRIKRMHGKRVYYCARWVKGSKSFVSLFARDGDGPIRRTYVSASEEVLVIVR